LPQKYSSYELCNILVTSESGYLTGKHQFQIRSRSDNSILQTGNISAQSATTGEWYNTTVSGGIATLILPYDTSNPISQYAGNYYVYATSPGYEDSDYGTQIVVMPHTVSEIRDILLTPIGGVPPAGNVTLRIQAFSETGPGVVNAQIFIAGVSGEGASVWDTHTASSTGYLAVSVPANSTYDIVASGAGYYDSTQRIEVFADDPPLIEIKLYLTGAPTLEPPTQPTGWPSEPPTTQPTGGIPDEDDDSEGFLMEAVRGIGLAFGVGFSTAKLIFGMLLALSIGYATAKQLRGGAAEFGLGLLGGTLLGVLIGLLPVWIIVVLLLVVGLYIGNRYVGGGANNG
ncbi:MAG: PT domain-containing protein, partial [Bacteroidales bacterium]|nr:PT domain-containing protein [Bacteroidales bacterium]